MSYSLFLDNVGDLVNICETHLLGGKCDIKNIQHARQYRYNSGVIVTIYHTGSVVVNGSDMDLASQYAGRIRDRFNAKAEPSY